MLTRRKSSRTVAPKPEDPTLEIMNAIRSIVQGLRVSSRQAEIALGISGAQLFVLQQLDANNGVSVNDLAARTFTHQSSVSVVISKLVKHGLVSRQPGSEDARKSEIKLTAKGQKFLAKRTKTAQELLIEAIGELRASDRQKLSLLLKHLVERAELGETVPNLFFEE